MKRLSYLMCSFLMVFAIAANASALTISSFDSANQRVGDLLTNSSYDVFRTALLDNGHTINAGVDSLTASALAGVDVFYWGTSSHVLSAAETAVLSSFVASGGSLIVEANSIQAEADAANWALAAAGLTASYGSTGSGTQGYDAGTFLDVETGTTVGPNGDLRGLSLPASICRSILDPNGEGTAVATWAGINIMVEFDNVLVVGDPLGWYGASSNPNAVTAYMNFIERDVAPVPEPGTMFLLGTGLFGFVASRRRKTKA